MKEAAVEYLDALAAADRARALALVRRLQAAGASALDVMTEVITPAQARVGQLWAANAWSVAQEHAATAVSESVLHLLSAQMPPPRDPHRPVVVSCVEQEWHALPALMVAEHLRAAQIPVSYLGANPSAEHLVRHVHEVGARAVALSCSLSASLPRVRRQVEAVRATGTPVVVGGAAFDAQGRRAAVLGANAFAGSAARAAEAVTGLSAAVSPVTPLTHEGADDGWAVYADGEELTVRLRWRVLSTQPESATGSEWCRALLDHLPHLVGAVAGALVADDRSVLDDAVLWLAGVMDHRSGPESVTADLLEALRDVVREYPAAARLLSRQRPVTRAG